jgi:ribosomal protein S18 acetylase RimI-like enzyme
MNLRFNLLTDNEVNDGYSLVCETSEWLQSRGLPNWKMTYDVFTARIKAKCLHGAFVREELVGIISLMDSHYPEHWLDYLPQEKFLWLSTLHVSRRFAGRGVGEFLVSMSDNVARKNNIHWILLDRYYGNGKLPSYYEQLGYKWIDRRVTIFENCKHDNVLLHKQL